jgi:hypothetical protein
MTKLPEPFKKSGQQIGPDGNNQVFFDAYTAEQMLQFRRDVLEEAAIEVKTEADYSGSNRQAVLTWAVNLIRKLKDET